MKENSSERSVQIDCFFLDFTGHPTHSTKFSDAIMILLCVVNSILVLPTILLNGLIVVTIWKTPSLYSAPSNLLLLCLACADFMNGLISEPFLVVHIIGEATRDAGLFCAPGLIMESVAWFASAISGTTVLALSVDRFIAVYMHLRYNEIVTVRRTTMFIAAMWPLFTVNIFARFIGVTNRQFVTANVTVILVSLVVIMLIYYKIFKIVSYHRVQIQAQVISASQSVSESTKTIHDLKARKSLLTVVYIVGLFWLGYLPFSCVLVSQLMVAPNLPLRTAYGIAATVVFSNSVVNPGLYCWRIGEIRAALLKYVRKSRVEQVRERTL